MNRKLLVIGFVVFCLFLLCGCTDQISNVDTFDTLVSKNYILYDVTPYSQNQILDLLQSEFDNGHRYIGSVSPDVTIGGRSRTIMIFEKGVGI